MSDELEPIEDDVPARELEEMPRLVETMTSENIFYDVEPAADLSFLGDGEYADLEAKVFRTVVEPWLGGIRVEVLFKNRYGASVIRNDTSYGSRAGLWELGTLTYDPANPNGAGLTQVDSVTGEDDCVVGSLDAENLLELFEKIADLPQWTPALNPGTPELPQG